ncbi:pleckstrin homology domain-containing family B member 2 isoform X4 [Gasterosteus aculeatus]
MAMVKSGWLHRQSTILRRWKRNWFDLWADGRLVFFNDQQRCDMEDELHMRVDCINIRGAAACPELNAPEAKVRDALFQIVCRDGRVVSLCAESADDALAWTMALQDARINTVSLNETSRRSSGSSCSAFTRGVLLSWFQVVSTPQVTFAQEVRPSAPPPYSDYAPPPQVFAQAPYGDFVAAPPPHAAQIVYSPDGQPYAVAYPYQYPGVYGGPGANGGVMRERQWEDGGDVALGMLAGAATGLAIGSLFAVF